MSQHVSSGLLLLVVLAVARPLAAQNGFALEIVPRVGIALSANPLGRLLPRDGGGYIVFDAIGFFPAVGTVIQLTRGASPWMLRGTVLRSIGAGVGAWTECASSICAFGGAPRSQTDVTVTTATLGVGRVLGAPDDGLRVFGNLAAGIRSYDLAFEAKDISGFVLHVGAGTELHLRGISVLLQLEDFAGVVEALGEDSDGRPRPGAPPQPRVVGGKHVVHDLSLSLGARIRVF